MVLSLIRFLLRMLRTDNACNSGNKTKKKYEEFRFIDRKMDDECHFAYLKK